MAFYLIDMAIFNSHVLYNKVNCGSKTGIVEFRLKLAEELLEQVVLPNYSTRGRPSSANALHATAFASKKLGSFSEEYSGNRIKGTSDKTVPRML